MTKQRNLKIRLGWKLIYFHLENMPLGNFTGKNIPILPSGILDFCKQKLWPLIKGMMQKWGNTF